jgi:predicted MPP superfamily phosphohydrolase
VPPVERSARRSRRSPLGILITLGIFTTLLGSAHYYFIARFVLDPGLTGSARGLAIAALVGLGLSIIFNPFIDRRFGPSVGRVLGWPAYIWLATCFYLLLGLGLSDLAIAVLGLSGPEIAAQRAQLVLGSVFAIIALGFANVMRLPRVKRVEHAIEGLPAALDGYRIVQLSDVHIGTLIGKRFVSRLTARVNETDADAVAITGDLVDGSVEHIGDRVQPFGQMRARDGVFFVTGNHDYYSNAIAWCARVRELGIRTLRNERVAVERKGARLWIAGVDDYSSRHRSAEDVAEALRGCGDEPVVLLAHDPRSFEAAQRQPSLRLQISGHTHGGQMWPFTWFVRLQTRFVKGLYRAGRAQLYVSLGTGYWGPPIRVLAPAEITLHVLRSPAAS